nr:MAG TPA: hypothetical protein [Crassvirales sp.]
MLEKLLICDNQQPRLPVILRNMDDNKVHRLSRKRVL